MKNIVLTGFMGSGKTAVGKELARMLSWRLVDVDDEIVRAQDMSINEIFARHGEAAFREIEAAKIAEIACERRVIISTGGGAVLRKENMAALRAHGVIVNLSAEPATILARTRGNQSRPLLRVADPLKKIEELLEARRRCYEDADIVIDTEDKTPLQIAEEILERMGWKT